MFGTFKESVAPLTLKSSTPRELVLAHPDVFSRRHIGPSESETGQMLEYLGLGNLEDLVAKAVPEPIRTRQEFRLPSARGEFELLAELRGIASQNKVFKSYIGMGYYDCITPPVIQRNILENPGWYTPYTPYQAEVAQGRLESLLNFQTMVMELTGMEIANASLLDESTAAAEAMHMSFSLKGNDEKNVFFVSDTCHPQTIDVVRTRAEPLGIRVEVGSHLAFQPNEKVFGVIVQYPASDGTIYDYGEFVKRAQAAGAMATVATDLLSLTLLKPPGEFGADIAVGSAQRFGVPLGYGGPHAAFFATKDAYKRQMPGRLVGVSKDAQGRPGYRLSLQTREQHIRRDKATSNICTAQALLANMAVMYAIYHGPNGLRKIARRVHYLTVALAEGLRKLGPKVWNETFFDTITVSRNPSWAAETLERAEGLGVNFRKSGEEAIGISLDETADRESVKAIWKICNNGQEVSFDPADLAQSAGSKFGAAFERQSAFLSEPVFNSFHSETEMLRYIRRLEVRDLSLTTSMIPLGSCTMKLNATSEMFPISWPEFNRIHPFAPVSQTKGYQILFRQLEEWLGEITGFAAISLQPNAGSQGEYAGLLTIRKYQESIGQGKRNVCLIPTSAHGTNPASAVMAGFHVTPVKCDQLGNIDLADLKAQAEANRDSLAVLMVTYPSTHGVFEESIKEVCQIIHDFGGQVYMDGANMNAQVGLCRPGELGADVCHLNLHKTFCIPHGGGGPGMGPIGVQAHLKPFLPSHSVIEVGPGNLGAISAAPWGSASILTISWVYIALMGPAGLTDATRIAILNANYVAKRLDKYFPVLYKGKTGMVAHECILDLRHFKHVTVEDVAKRLMDYGFHAPTISWPVGGTMMIEPTESESKEELDRFCEALIAIHSEIKAIENGRADRHNNVLKNAPHTAEVLLSDKWDRPYPREQGAYPAPWLRYHKFWPVVGRIDNVYGDRNLVCSCAGMEEYMSDPKSPA